MPPRSIKPPWVKCTGAPICKKRTCPHYKKHRQSEKYFCKEPDDCYVTKKIESCAFCTKP